MKNAILIFGLFFLSLCIMGVYAEPALNDENLTDIPSEDMVTLPNGTTVNIVVFMPITVMINSDDGHPLRVLDTMNFSTGDAMMMSNGTFPTDAIGDGFFKQIAGKNMTPVLNGTGIKHIGNTTSVPKVAGNQSSTKPNLTITW